MMQNGRTNSPKLRPRLSSSETEIEKHVHMLRERGANKNKNTNIAAAYDLLLQQQTLI